MDLPDNNFICQVNGHMNRRNSQRRCNKWKNTIEKTGCDLWIGDWNRNAGNMIWPYSRDDHRDRLCAGRRNEKDKSNPKTKDEIDSQNAGNPSKQSFENQGVDDVDGSHGEQCHNRAWRDFRGVGDKEETYPKTIEDQIRYSKTHRQQDRRMKTRRRGREEPLQRIEPNNRWCLYQRDQTNP